MSDWKRMTEGISETIELTEDSSRELLRLLEEKDAEFVNELLEGKRDFTIRGSDGRSVELTPKALEKKEVSEWIPCCERLPKDNGHYICSFVQPQRIDKIHIGLAYCDNGRWVGYNAREITAWMPLPDPWKGTAE